MRIRLASGNARNSLILSERFFSCLASFVSCSCYNGEGQSTTGAMVRLLILNSLFLYSSVRLTHTGRIVVLFVMFGVLAIAFAGVQFWKGDDATVPPRILKQRSIAFGCWYIFCLGGSFFVRTYISLIIRSIMQVSPSCKSGSLAPTGTYLGASLSTPNSVVQLWVIYHWKEY